MRKALVIAALASLVSACGGGGGGGGGQSPSPVPPPPAPAPAPQTASDLLPPTVVAFQPSTTQRVPRTTELSATFNEALRADTANAANLRLARAGTAVPGNVAYDAASFKATYTPERPLDLLASYTVTVGTGITDLAGNGFAAEQAWSFRTQDGSWQGARRLDSATATSIYPDVAAAGTGKTAIVWSNQAVSGWYEIRAVIQENDSWGSVETLSLPGTYDAVFPKVRFDAQGNGLAVWTQGTSLGGASLWSARFVQGQGWQAPVAVDANPADMQEASLAMDAAGNAVVSWVKRIGPGLTGNNDTFAALFTPTGGWQAPTRLGSAANIGTYDQASLPNVILDANGDAYVLWVQNTSDSPVWFAQFQAGTGWQPAMNVGATRMGDPFAPRLAISSTGQVVAVWNSVVYAGGPYRFDLWFSVLATASGSWSAPALLETDDAGNALNQQITADSAGNVHVVWQQFATEYKSVLLHRQYAPGTGWNTAATISEADGAFDNNRSPKLVADRNGNLMALWGVYASGYGGTQEGTFARRHIAGEGWQAIVRVSQAGGSPALNTALAVGTDGSITAGWMQPDAFRSDGQVWVNLLK